MELSGIGWCGLVVSCTLLAFDGRFADWLCLDMAIAVPGVVVSTNDVVSIENSLNSLFNVQNASTGQLPYAGNPFPPILSFTYHLYTLIGVADHYLYTVSVH